MKYCKIYFYLTLVAFTSCQNMDTSKAKHSLDEVFVKREEKINNFLFLDFWTDMNNEEYTIIRDSLINSKKLIRTDTTMEYIIHLEGISYSDSSKKEIRNVIFEFVPNFINDSLKNIRLNFIRVPGFVVGYKTNKILVPKESIYKLFKSKYQIPKKVTTKYSDDISYLWTEGNKIIEIIEEYELEWNIFEEKNNKVFSAFKIIYYNKDYYNELQEQNKIEKEQNNQQIEKKASETIKDL